MPAGQRHRAHHGDPAISRTQTAWRTRSFVLVFDQNSTAGGYRRFRRRPSIPYDEWAD